ncbi:MAG: Txe/YoeB family addiction module toxin [Flavobacteriales bacterium]|nr:Txe/YoeB family addiction module toxin [Flavobacteriales bacterium]
MGKFVVVLTEKAKNDISLHKRSGNKAIERKIKTFLEELKVHPFTGTGQPESLKHELQGFWSRRLNQKDRMIYSVDKEIVTVEVVSAMGHYFDK